MAKPIDLSSCYSVMRDSHGGTVALKYSGDSDRIWLECLDADGAFCKVGLPWQDVREACAGRQVVGASAWLSARQARALAATLIAWADDAEEGACG